MVSCSSKTILTLLFQILLWAELIGGSTASIAQAATFNIANGDVTGLIRAINTANGNGVPDTINLAADGLYTLTTINNTTGGANGLPVITSNITINGNNATFTRASNAPNFRLMYIASSGSLQLNNLTLSNGRVSPGGGLYNAGGTLTLNSSTVAGNLAFGTIQGVTGFAGGIFNSGTLTLNGSTVSGNTATGGIEANTGSTGGIGNSGTATLNDSIVSGNAAGDTGGILNSGTLTLNNSIVSGNTAPMFKGGGISNTGTLSLLNSTVSNNFAMESGGGIYNTGPVVTISNGIISSNTARDGGGIWNNGGINLIDTTINNNNATGAGGGIRNAGILTINHSTLSGNISTGGGGGLYNDGGTITLNNCTVADNTAHFGGGLWVGAGQMTLTFCTISGNSATETFGSGYNGGGLLNASNEAVILKSTILAGNTAQAQGSDCYNLTVLTSQGYNIVGNNDGCAFTSASGDQVGTPGSPIDPRLGPLQANGGPTQTRALLSNSPATDAVAGGNCTDSGVKPSPDQRGQPRPLDGNGDGSAACDSGAYETPLLYLSSSASPNPALAGQTIIYTYRIENTGAMTLTNLSATDDFLGAISLSSTNLAPGQAVTSTLSHVVVEADLPGPLVSNAFVTGTAQTGGFLFTTVSPISVTLIGPQYFPLILKLSGS
ncbi:MAG: choice-of-anchor Q domain-containing protein [Anaerolineae bacterium]